MYKYLVFALILFIKSINIIILQILHITLPFGIENTKCLKLVFFIKKNIYMRFDQLSSCLYIYDKRKSFKNMQIYLRVFDIIVIDSINIKIFEKTFFK